MEEIGKSIKSFNADTITCKTLEVTNYPIRKRTKDEISRISKIRRIRGVQLLVSNAIGKHEAEKTVDVVS